MPVISSKEFITNQKKYFDMAMNTDVFIKKGKKMFVFSNANEPDEFLEPDDDFRRALSAEEFRKQLIQILEKRDKQFAKQCK
jgi:predicted transcriptional regulator